MKFPLSTPSKALTNKLFPLEIYSVYMWWCKDNYLLKFPTKIFAIKVMLHKTIRNNNF